MSSWLELLLLAIASMFWPTLIVIVVVALRLEHPVKILSWFLVGGLLTTVTVGIVIVFGLEGAISGGSQSSVDPAVDIAVGSLSLLGAYLLYRRERKQQPPPSKAEVIPTGEKKPSVAERAVGGGAAVAFAAGVVLNILPGTFPIVALKDIAELDASDTAKVVAIVVFYVINVHLRRGPDRGLPNRARAHDGGDERVAGLAGPQQASRGHVCDRRRRGLPGPARHHRCDHLTVQPLPIRRRPAGQPAGHVQACVGFSTSV